MKIGVVMLVVLVGAGCDAGSKISIFNKPTKVEHGWKTQRVVATYLPKTGIGYSLKFSFPENEYDSDRADVSDTFEDYGCNIYQGGGFPGAPAYVACEGVNDDQSADAKLKELLPVLDDVLRRLSSSSGALAKSAKTKAREAAQPKTHEEWIALMNAKKRGCKGAEGSWMGSGTTGYSSYSETCTHGVEVFTDTTAETQAWKDKEQTHRDSLASALVTRVLSKKEMEEVGRTGSNLLVREMTPYSQEDVERRFQSMLAIQQALRAGH